MTNLLYLYNRMHIRNDVSVIPYPLVFESTDPLNEGFLASQ